MNAFTTSIAIWLADYYLLSGVLLAITLVALAALKQPAQRLAITKSTLVALFLLSALCAAPGWSIVHLISGQQPSPNGSPVEADQVETPVQPALTTAPPHAAAAPTQPTASVILHELTEPDEIFWANFSGPAVLTFMVAAGGMCVLMWLCVGAIAARRLVRSAQPAPAELSALMTEVAASDHAAAALLISRKIDVAVALGLWRPAILLPQPWTESQPREQLRSVLAHEWAHLRNHDLHWLAASRALLTLLWPQPLFWLLRRRMRLDQEALADAAAAEITSRQTYAEQLVAWARHIPPRPAMRLSAAVGLWEGPSQLRQRIALLLDERIQLLRDCSLRWSMTVASTVVAAACGLSLITLQPATDAAAQPETAVESRQAALEYHGSVVDKRSGQPIAGVKVVVRRQTSSTDPWKTLAETDHITASDGTYHFTIPPEQLADSHLYIQLDVTHPEYAPKTGFGYALSMIRKNEKLGARPFFDRVELEPAEPIFGIVTTPDGAPAANMPVKGYSMADPKDMSEYGSFDRGQTDAEGRFRLRMIRGGRAILWLLPDDFAQQTHIIDQRRGNLGTFQLENGIRLNGRVVDRDGQPMADVWVNAELVDGPAQKPIQMSVADSIERSALTDTDGKFEIRPLPPSTYRVWVAEEPREIPRRDRKPRPLHAVFVPQRITLVPDQSPAPLAIQAAEPVTIEAQIYDRSGKHRSGHEVDFFGRSNDKPGESYFAQGKPDQDGHVILRVPKGLSNAILDLSCNEHQVLRYRRAAGGDLRSERRIEFGTLTRDQRGIEIIYYTAPILIVSARDENGTPIPDFKPAVFYRQGVKPRKIGSRWISGVDGEVNFEKQEDGRWRSEQLLPDEAFIVNVLAEGYETSAQSLSLKEGEVKELDVTLKTANLPANAEAR